MHKAAGSTALVVDDNTVIRKILALLPSHLSSGFGTCAEAENGQEGIEVARQIQEPDVIALDLSMPVMNGLEAAAEAPKNLSENPNYPVHSLRRQPFAKGRRQCWR